MGKSVSGKRGNKRKRGEQRESCPTLVSEAYSCASLGAGTSLNLGKVGSFAAKCTRLPHHRDLCAHCGMGDNLLIFCAECPRSYHERCAVALEYEVKSESQPASSNDESLSSDASSSEPSVMPESDKGSCSWRCIDCTRGNQFSSTSLSSAMDFDVDTTSGGVSISRFMQQLELICDAASFERAVDFVVKLKAHNMEVRDAVTKESNATPPSAVSLNCGMLGYHLCGIIGSQVV